MNISKKETNTLYRKKYFVDSSEVIRYRPAQASPKSLESSAVIRKEQGAMSDIRLPMNKPAPPADAQIEVQIQRKESDISGIRITCPCGRHAEVDLDPSAGAGKGGKA